MKGCEHRVSSGSTVWVVFQQGGQGEESGAVLLLVG